MTMIAVETKTAEELVADVRDALAAKLRACEAHKAATEEANRCHRAVHEASELVSKAQAALLARCTPDNCDWTQYYTW